MRVPTALRFAIEAAFLVGVAVAVALLELSVWAIVAAMVVAWLVVAAFERHVSRGRSARPAVEGADSAAAVEAAEAEPRPEPEPEPEAEPVTVAAAAGAQLRPVVAPQSSERPRPEDERAQPRRPERRRLVRPRPRPAPVPATADAEPESRVSVVPRTEPTAPELPTPAAVEESGVPPEAVVELIAPEPEPVVSEPQPSEPEPVADPAPPVLVAVPSPAAEPDEGAPPGPEPAVGESATVVALPPRGPREWNLWDLERLTREASGSDAFRDEERAYLLVYLREFASADGILPIDFDGLVRESFGDLVGAG
jgi:hypothetical protein